MRVTICSLTPSENFGSVTQITFELQPLPMGKAFQLETLMENWPIEELTRILADPFGLLDFSKGAQYEWDRIGDLTKQCPLNYF